MNGPRSMLFRFCLYGFLKNQQYYDPFLILAFLQKGLSFAAIGVLISFRAICVNLMEIPAGAVARRTTSQIGGWSFEGRNRSRNNPCST